MLIRGKVVKIGDNIDTDLIIPGRYLQITEIDELKEHVFEDLGEVLREKITPGTILVAGENFGCGSSREQAPRVLKAAGVSAIVAKSFARIFLRNSINIGLPIFVSPEVVENVLERTEVEIDTQKGVINVLHDDKNYYFDPYPEFLEELVGMGGLVNFVKSQVNKHKRRP
ncbi:3-isopropylmalate dehydratase, small subunit [Thermovirga lienii DSM 17291]|uniref:3-isopropylmalate dehydratase small subunit n=1 Tax=Thermovirga lienii (strain ATCC BAA-1197 / DSM 17291 / Cas60314) TaxID=580340 RepID=G7V909_THELD|nr:3-isopropylmalate dehydratase small subunit [Thermovirga lienii]AER67543.1 3-isopropylmalate dehydratase, small subunit [Thermovirga lienii DSM 17291]